VTEKGVLIGCFVRHTAATCSEKLYSSIKQSLNSSRTGQCRVNLHECYSPRWPLE